MRWSKTKPAKGSRAGRPVRPYAYEAVIFDIDNVLVDTTRSYRDAIRWTVEIYLTGGPVPFFVASKPPGRKPSILSASDVDHFKWLGGFNDDWDCCYGLLVYLLNLDVKKKTVRNLKEKIDVAGFARTIKTRPLGVAGIVRRLGRPTGVKIENISRIFQEIYLGRELFEKIESQQAMHWIKRGLIHREKLIFRRSTLRKLKKAGIKLGIATGRPRFEALYCLKRFRILDYFDALTTIDEVKQAESEQKQSLRKPHPFSLIETAKKLGVSRRAAYIGDLPDDLLAAKRARPEWPIDAIAFPVLSCTDPEALRQIRKMRPEFILKKPVELPPIILRKTKREG